MSTNTISKAEIPGVFNKMSDALFSIPFFKWFVREGYVQGVFWAVMISVISVTNDVLMRFLGERLHPVEISFFRFFFSMISILPLMVTSGSTLFKTQQPMMHVLRAILGALALGLCCYSVNIMPLSEYTTIMFCEPLFFLPLAYILLKEKVDTPRWIATIIGFVGLMIILRPGTDAFRVVAFVPMLSLIHI
jgi:S-adenosylmethionine uptake transporter